jgi:hypothetical protein
MLQLTVEKNSFAGGEISPVLHRRHDLQRHPTAVARLENFVVLMESPLARAPGTRFIGALADETQPALLIPFLARRGDSRMLVLNAGKARVVVDDGFVQRGGGFYEFDVPWSSEAELDALRFGQSVDVMFVADGARPPRTITRMADDDFQVGLYDYRRGPFMAQNLDEARTIAASAVEGEITLTANFDAFQPGHAGALWRLDESDLSLVAFWSANETVTTADVSGAPPFSYPAASQRRFRGNVYAAVGEGGGVDSGPNAPTHDEGDVQSAAGKVKWRFLYRGHGFVRILEVLGARQARALVLERLPDSCAVSPTYRWREGAWSDARGWPDGVYLHERRIVWVRRDEIFMTRSGDFFDFEATGDDPADAINVRLVPPDGSLAAVRWIGP